MENRKRINRFSLTAAFLGMIALIVASCSSSSTSSTGASVTPVSTEPVTLSFFVAVPGFTDDAYKQLIEEPTKLKHPNITLQLLRPGTGTRLPDLVAAGQTPDLMYGAFGNNLVSYHKELNATADLAPLIKKFNMDINQFNPLIIKTIKAYGDGAIYSLPFTQNTFGMFYNKTIFDKFGVAYPKDGMLWQDAIELARKVSRIDGGVHYRGLEVYNNKNINTLASQLSLDRIDPKTNKAFVSDKWKEVFQLAMDVYNVPGNKPDAFPPTLLDEFVNTQTLAMAPTFTNGLMATIAKDQNAAGNLNWDVVQAPSYKEAPNTSFQLDVHQISISSTSKYQDQAFQVLALATSQEVQAKSTRMGLLTALNDQTVKSQYALDLTFAKGKNMQSILKSAAAAVPTYNEYSDLVSAAIQGQFKAVYDGKIDINTALRQAQEKADQDIAAAINGK